MRGHLRIPKEYLVFSGLLLPFSSRRKKAKANNKDSGRVVILCMGPYSSGCYNNSLNLKILGFRPSNKKAEPFWFKKENWNTKVTRIVRERELYVMHSSGLSFWTCRSVGLDQLFLAFAFGGIPWGLLSLRWEIKKRKPFSFLFLPRC